MLGRFPSDFTKVSTFYTGQAIYLQYTNAHIADLFAFTAMPTDLAEPAVPIFGTATGLPSISKLIAPAESTAVAPTVKPVATPRSELSNIPGLIDGLNKDEFFQAPSIGSARHCGH